MMRLGWFLFVHGKMVGGQGVGQGEAGLEKGEGSKRKKKEKGEEE